LNSYIITKNYVQFSFEIITLPKREGKLCIGIDTGINALASLNNGKQYGLDIKECIERVKRCVQGSKGYYVAKRALKQRIDEVAIEIVNTENPDLMVVEKLKSMGKKSKAKRLLAKSIRRSIGTWNWKYWLKRLEAQCEINRVSFRSVAPYYTSTTCPVCGGKQVVDKIAQVYGKGSVNGSFSLGYGSVYGSSNIDTKEVNHCSKCGHEWKKYKTEYKWKSDIIVDYLNHTFEFIKDEKSVWDFYKRDFEKLRPYYAETIYKLLSKHGGECYSSTINGLTLGLLRTKFVSIFDEKIKK
jgi:IS605 OrfB family transposase